MSPDIKIQYTCFGFNKFIKLNTKKLKHIIESLAFYLFLLSLFTPERRQLKTYIYNSACFLTHRALFHSVIKI